MNATSCTRSQTRDGSVPRTWGTPHPLLVRAVKRPRTGSANLAGKMRRNAAGRQASNSISAVIEVVVAEFMDSLRSTGEGALPLVLALRPELPTRGVAEDDAEFARRERLQSTAERRFFRTIEPALRDALTRVFTLATRAGRRANVGAR